ncbi:MAG: 4-(cytidine 5'-diphospho)-2-C-methyl-D-erythritol kinase [Deltaproteobacteria bacterium]|nr:4-(cytidine 5'-diphospho)-2-C-methyl-D-erythritol kinase [Deltaproteobacteria bacterium]
MTEKPNIIRTPAKINTLLKVTGRRPNGYHELVSIMIPVEIFDLLEFEILQEKAIWIQSTGYHVPNDEKNLVHRAARSFLSRTGISHGVSIRLEKNIPVAAGLGGGSSDAAATLLMLNRVNSMPLTESDLREFAVELGADVPFFLNCMPSLATGIGEIIEPLEGWPEFWYVIVTPPIRISTMWVYQNLKLELTTKSSDCILANFRSETFKVENVLENDLENVTCAKFPIINTLKKLLVDAGAKGAMMSGSGPSVFGLFSSLANAADAEKFLISQNMGDVFLAKSIGSYNVS